MSRADHDGRVARAMLTQMTEPADPGLGQLLSMAAPSVIIEMARSNVQPDTVQLSPDGQADVQATMRRLRDRIRHVPPDGGLAEADQRGITLICPGDPGWPAGLDDLGLARPYGLWARGAELPHRTAIAVAGSRAASAYGTYVATEITSGLTASGVTVVSGAAYGIDAAAHRAALSSDGPTIAVLASGPGRPYPAGHAALLDQIAVNGTILSEYPPGTAPSRQRFLRRNRIIAAITSATVIIEASTFGGAMITARHAIALRRPLLAVPGPVTSELSAGCHQLIRSGHAVLACSAADVLAAT